MAKLKEKPNGTLVLKIKLSKELISEDLADSAKLIGAILEEDIKNELDLKGRRISRIKNPAELTLKIKTAKL